jgi:hypothetical protein
MIQQILNLGPAADWRGRVAVPRDRLQGRHNLSHRGPQEQSLT